MGINIVENWSYDEPTAPGLYLCCYGDVETHDNISFVRFFEDDDGLLADEAGDSPGVYNCACKWARLLVSISEVEEFCNEWCE